MILFFSFLIVVHVQSSPFSYHHFPLPHPSPPPTLNPSPLWLCPLVLFLIFTFILLFLLIIFYTSNTVVSIFTPPLSPTPPTPTSYPQSYPPLALSISPLYMFLDDPFPAFSCYLPPCSPLVTVSLFFISMSLVIFYSLVCFVE